MNVYNWKQVGSWARPAVAATAWDAAAAANSE